MFHLIHDLTIHKKHYLTKEETQQLSILKKNYIAGLLKRSHGPDHFETNINYLKDFRQAHSLWRTIIEPYIKKEMDTRKCISYYHQAMVDLKRNALNEARNKIFTHHVNKLVEREFDKEPRIVKFCYTEHLNEATLKKCSITFSDGFELELKSLDDELELTKAKIIFEEKMQELKNIMQESQSQDRQCCICR